MSFLTSLTGLNAASTKLSAASNNIANAATDTFKRSDVDFADVYAQNVRQAPGNTVGNGVMTAKVTQQFTQGSITNTGRTLDLAIAGNGFFATQPNSAQNTGQIYYTRGGSFDINSQNDVVTSSGDKLLIKNNTGGLQPLSIPPKTTGKFEKTTAIRQQILLPINTQPPEAPFDKNKLNSFNASNNFTFYDNQGRLQNGTIYYIRQPQNPNSNLTSWDLKVFAGNQPINPKTSNTTIKVQDSPNVQRTAMGFKWDVKDGNLSINEGDLIISGRNFYIEGNKLFEKTQSGNVEAGGITKSTSEISLNFYLKPKEKDPDFRENYGLSAGDIYDFMRSDSFNQLVKYEREIKVDGSIWLDQNGKMISGLEKQAYDFPGVGVINFDRQNSRATSGNFSIIAQASDGKPEGDLSGINIDANGNVVASYSNGSNNNLGQLQITTFANPGGLRQIGDTRYVATNASGQANDGTPGTEGFGSVRSGSIERSNVDITTELVDLIMAQRNFQANSKAIEIDNTMTKSVIDSVRS